MIIAIDGYSSTGKSSLAKKIANHLKYKHIDSGAMYRAVALLVLQNQLFLEEQKLDEGRIVQLLPHIKIDFKLNDKGDGELYLDGENVEDKIRSLEVSKLVSKVAKIEKVRNHLVNMQRKMARDNDVVMDGRDIGSIVFPKADVKLFLKVDTEERAMRRYRELKEKGVEVSLEDVIENINERDFLDTTREVSPLVKAEDAIEINNTNQTIEETFKKALECIELKKIAKK